MVSDTVVSSTYFHMLKMLGTENSLIIRRKSQGDTPDGTLRHPDRQSLLSLTVWDKSERKSMIQLMILVGTLIYFNFVTKVL